MLAAGQGRRMRGADKLLEDVDGQPLIRHLANRALASAATSVIVAVPSGHTDRIAALAGLPVTIVEVPDAVEGMSASLRAAAQQIGDADSAIVMLGDMPDISTTLLDRLIARAGAQGGAEIVRPVLRDGRAGHPVLFGKSHVPALCAVTGDRGARDVIAAAHDALELIEVEDDAPLTDLDTPEAWADWRARRNG
nr:nucleotidyltransferase family protein [Pontivivens insulae]